MLLISEHLYWMHINNVVHHSWKAMNDVERLASDHRRHIEKIPGLQDKDIRIALDEWNYWYGPNKYGELGVRYLMRDALGCAGALHAMFRNSDLFYMANYAQTVNVLGAIKASKTRAFMERTGKALVLYRKYFGTLPVTVQQNVSGVDVAAAWTTDHSALTLAVVNANGKPVSFQLEVDGLEVPESLHGWQIQNDDPDMVNEADTPDSVSIKDVVLEVSKNTVNLPPYSITLVRIPKSER